MSRYHFLLGGHDLEMLEIARLLTAHGQAFSDRRLSWGARLSAYADVLAGLPAGVIPVAVELIDDLDGQLAPWRSAVIAIDHHGERVAEPPSIRQVFGLLGLPDGNWTRHLDLVAANDVGHVAAMRRAGASESDMRAIRAADRRAQGITAAEEEGGRAALRHAEVRFGTTIVTLAHNHMATVTDPLALAPAFRHLPRPLLARGRSELAYFGHPATVDALDRAMPGGWRGGNPPHQAFWGCGAVAEHLPALLAKALACLAETASNSPSSKDI
jgi:hypothetical protein